MLSLREVRERIGSNFILLVGRKLQPYQTRESIAGSRAKADGAVGETARDHVTRPWKLRSHGIGGGDAIDMHRLGRTRPRQRRVGDRLGEESVSKSRQ
jgi:hypothetical protein